MTEPDWGLAVEFSPVDDAGGGPPRIRAAVAEGDRIKLLKPVAVGPADPAGRTADGVSAILAVATRARGDRDATSPARLAVIGFGDNSPEEFAQLQTAAQQADLPEPELVARPIAAARYFRSTLAFPRGTAVIVVTMDDHAASATPVAYTTGAATAAADIVAVGGRGPVPIALSATELDRRFVELVAAQANTGAIDLPPTEIRRLRELLAGRAYIELRSVDADTEIRIARSAYTRVISGIVGAAVGDLERLLRELRPDPGTLAGIYLVAAAARVPSLPQRIREQLGCCVFLADRREAAVLGALAGPGNSGASFFEDEVPLADLPSEIASLPGISSVADAITESAYISEPVADTDEPHATARQIIDDIGTDAHPTLVTSRRIEAGTTSTLLGGGQSATGQYPAPSNGGSHNTLRVPPRQRTRSVRTPRAVIAAVIVAGLAGGGYLMVHALEARPSSPNRQSAAGAPQPSTSPAAPSPTFDAGTVTTDSPSALPSDEATATDSSTITDSPAPSPSLGSQDPATVVLAYFAAINAQNYQQAWDLGGKNLDSSYQNFVSGFSNTSQDSATTQDIDTNTASVQLTATQTDGSVQNFSGTFTVAAGVITGASMQQTN
ncbi:MAG TPA: hypothetical protein VFU65_21790 [Actinocrinis sp.]|nr:hypothetical protein [Actinocrinis sp.]